MKQKYVKPMVNIEYFALSQSIALNCGKNLDEDNKTWREKYECGWDITGGTGAVVLFVEGVRDCNQLAEEFEGVCYNNPEGGFNVFDS